jgi:hypothetical protein
MTPASTAILSRYREARHRLWHPAASFLDPAAPPPKPLAKPWEPDYGPLPFGPVAAVLAATARVTGFTEDAICSPSRRRRITMIRQVAMYVAAQHAGYGKLSFIGRMFGGRDPSTVHNAVKKIERRPEAYAELIARIEARLEGH